jgi:hypothetical protein
MTRQPGTAPEKRHTPGNRPRADCIPERTTAEVTAALKYRKWLWRRLFPALILALQAAMKGGHRYVFAYGRSQVTVISHLFLQPGSVVLLTHFVVQSAGFGLLIPGIRSAMAFTPRKQSTWFAVPVAAIAMPADRYFLMTTLAVENPAVLFCHLVSAQKGLYRDRRKRDAPSGASKTLWCKRCPDVPRGVQVAS